MIIISLFFRSLAFIFDVIIVSIIIFIFSYVMIALLFLSGSDGWYLSLHYYLFVYWLYFLITEVFSKKKRSIGKRLFGIKIIGLNDKEPTRLQLFLRILLFFAPFHLVLFLINLTGTSIVFDTNRFYLNPFWQLYLLTSFATAFMIFPNVSMILSKGICSYYDQIAHTRVYFKPIENKINISIPKLTNLVILKEFLINLTLSFCIIGTLFTYLMPLKNTVYEWTEELKHILFNDALPYWDMVYKNKDILKEWQDNFTAAGPTKINIPKDVVLDYNKLVIKKNTELNGFYFELREKPYQDGTIVYKLCDYSLTIYKRTKQNPIYVRIGRSVFFGCVKYSRFCEYIVYMTDTTPPVFFQRVDFDRAHEIIFGFYFSDLFEENIHTPNQ